MVKAVLTPRVTTVPRPITAEVLQQTTPRRREVHDDHQGTLLIAVPPPSVGRSVLTGSVPPAVGTVVHPVPVLPLGRR